MIKSPLTGEQLRHYFLNGYLVVPGLARDAVIDDVLAHAGVTDEDLAAGT